MYINIHTHYLSIKSNVKSVLNVYPEELPHKGLWFSTGIHPWYLKRGYEKEIQDIKEHLKNPKCIAIGECGLDKNIKVDFSFQKEVFKQHIQLSEKHKKPLIIHCVKSYNEIIQLKKEYKPTQKWLIHGFNKRLKIVELLVENDILMSYGTALLTNKSTQNSFVHTPLEFIFLETDNTSVSIAKIYEKAAEIKQISVEKLTLHLHLNFKKYFLKNE